MSDSHERRVARQATALAIVRGYLPGCADIVTREKARLRYERNNPPQRIPNPPIPEPETFIYFLRAGEFVKIGRSRSWKARMASMQTGSPYTIVPLLIIKGPHSLEKKLHSRFRSDHFRGEWFHLGPAIRAYIKQNLKDCLSQASESVIPQPEWPDFTL